MVGVPGKYKGCETCRRRRVKCTNERPLCGNCVNSGRQCEGYERQRVFITGTPETMGRVASHPKRTGSANKPKSEPAAAPEGAWDDSKPQLVPTESLAMAWGDAVALSGQGIVPSAPSTGLQTDLCSVLKQGDADNSGFAVLMPANAASEPQAHAEGVELDAIPLRGDDAHGPTGGYCTPLYEAGPSRSAAVTHRLMSTQQASSSAVSSMLAALGESSSRETNLVERLGPDSFASFPNHQYFARIYQPLAVSSALFSHCDSFLSRQDWMSTPWNWHPKSPLDYLLDVVLRLPPVLAMANDLRLQPATMARHLEAQGLLQSCLVIEMQFLEWFQSVTLAPGSQEPPWWCQELGEGGGEIPFTAPYAFRDGPTALMMLYYWMAQILLHRCIESLHSAIFQPVVDAYPDMWLNPSPNLQVDVTHYQDGRELAANICRGLDSALVVTTQPDMLMAPVALAINVYRDVSATSQDSILEILWLEAFQKRLAHKGQHVASIVQQQRWIQVARY